MIQLLAPGRFALILLSVGALTSGCSRLQGTASSSSTQSTSGSNPATTSTAGTAAGIPAAPVTNVPVTGGTAVTGGTIVSGGTTTNPAQTDPSNGGTGSTTGNSGTDQSSTTNSTTTPDSPTVVRKAGSVSLAGVNQTTVPFGSGFQGFIYSQTLPGAVSFTGLSGKVAIDSNSPYFSEALFTVGYSPNNNCPGNGQSFMDIDAFFKTMPGAVILSQYIIKIVGGHAELPTNFTLAEPVPVSGCAFMILDGDAGAKGSVDTLTSQVSFNYVDGPQDSNNVIIEAGGGEYCSGFPKGCNSSTTNQWRTASMVYTSGLLTSLTGSISAAPLYIAKSTNLPQGNWSVHNTFYVDKGCSGGGGNQNNQDFYGRIPANAVTLADIVQNSGGGNVVQQSVNQSLQVQVQAGDCIVQLLATSGAGPIDIEVQMKANIGDQPYNPVVGTIDSFDGQTAMGWACAKGLDQSIAVDLYAGALGQGVMLTEVQATQTSEPAVAAACGANGTAYRFAYTFSADEIATAAGQSLYAYGISPNGGDNVALANSGGTGFE